MTRYVRKTTITSFALLLILLIAVSDTSMSATTDQIFEEIPVNFRVRHLINRDIFVQYDGEHIYLPIIEIFNQLDLKIDADIKNKRFRGFVISSKNKYDIDLERLRVEYPGGKLQIEPDQFVLTTTDLYLRTELYETIFGIPINFNFSELQVTLPLNEDFPAYQKLKRSLEHKRLKKQEVALRDVKRLPYKRSLLAGGVLDWSLSASPVGDGTNYFGFSLGSMILGGDLTVSGTGNSQTGFNEEQLRYRWHYYFDWSPYLSQAEIGDVFTGGILSRGLRGGMITNKPQTNRTYFRTIRVEGQPGPDWEVELFLDRNLIDYTHTDQSGSYEFLVDINYGASLITIKMYGPNGEIKTEEQYVRVPYNIIPKNTVEYTVTVGEGQSLSLNRKYAQAIAYYGLTNKLTVGLSGDAPLDKFDDEPFSFAGDATYQLFGNLTMNGTYAPGYAARGAMNFNKPSLVSVDGSFTKYYENKFRNFITLDQSIMLSISAPIRFGHRRLNLRYYMTWDKYPNRDAFNINFGGTASLPRANVYYLGKYQINKYPSSTVTQLISEVFTSLTITRWFRPQFRFTYNHSKKELVSTGVYFNKRIYKQTQFTFSYERDIPSGTNMFRLSFNMFTDFAGFTTRVASTGDATNVTQVQNGSIRYDNESKRVILDRYYGVGRSFAVVRPFMDDNLNGRIDNNEEYVEGLKAQIKGGRERKRGKQKLYYYDGLNPYDEQTIRIDPLSLDDPLLKPIYENYEVAMNPNVVTAINVPMVIAGEVTGYVMRESTLGDVGQGGINVVFYNQAKESVTEITTFSNGEYFYLGLIPGSYKAYVSTEQLKRLGYRCEPESMEFEMETVKGGAIVSDLNFKLIPLEEKQ